MRDFWHIVCKTATLRTQNKHEKASFIHYVKKNRVRYTCRKRVIITRVFFSPEQSEGDKLHPYGNHPLCTLVSKITIFTLRAQSVVFAHARIKKHALNQALYTSYKKLCSNASEKVILFSCGLFATQAQSR